MTPGDGTESNAAATARLFCSERCLQDHHHGEEPGVPSEEVQAYLESRNAENAEHLLLLQAHASRMYEDRSEIDKMEDEIRKRKQRKDLPYEAPVARGARPGEQYAGEAVRGYMSPAEQEATKTRGQHQAASVARVARNALIGQWYRGLKENETTWAAVPHEVLKKAKEVSKSITKRSEAK